MELKFFPRKKRGFYFSTDAVIALIIIFVILIIAIPLREEFTNKNEIHHDILATLATLKIGEIDNSYVRNLINSGEIKELNKSILEQIGEYYVTNITKARELSQAVLENLSLRENIGIWYGSTMIFSKNQSPIENAKNIQVTRRFISGLKEGESITGFSVKANLINSLQSNYYYFGGYVGDGNITQTVLYNGNISKAFLELVVNEDFDVYINGNYSGRYSKSNSSLIPARYNLPTEHFMSGIENKIEFRGNYLHIAGGYLKIEYQSEPNFQQQKRYYFHGINGMINIYDGIFIPENLESMYLRLHFNISNSPLFLTIGNKSVYYTNLSGERTIELDNSTLSNLLDYKSISKKTIPIRIGLENITYSLKGQNIDVVSVTDISGSMGDCGKYVIPYTCRYNCLIGGNKACNVNSPSQCSGNICGGFCWLPNNHRLDCNKTLLDLAKESNAAFIDVILNSSSNNRVGLAAYNTTAPDNAKHILSTNKTSLLNKMDSWRHSGSTCICCGINKAVNIINNQSNSEKFKSIVIMSDGLANVQCSEQGTGDAKQDAIKAACDARNLHNITVYSIGFGSEADEPTLQSIASCGNGSYFYSSIEQLSEIYGRVAENIFSSFAEQTINLIGNIENSKLYTDSFIEFNYSSPTQPKGLILTAEYPFNSEYGGNFSIPLGSQPIEARVSSYSGTKWTDQVSINGFKVYKLSDYGTHYTLYGDPYIIHIPPNLIEAGQTHTVNVTTGTSPLNSSTGSTANKIFITIVRNATSFSPILPNASGCKWQIFFDDGTNMSFSSPKEYSGAESCFFGPPHGGLISNNNDASQIAVLHLLEKLDLDNDKAIDIRFDEKALEISTNEIFGIPYTWTTEVQARIWS